MALRCLLFSSDERSAARLGEVLAGLNVEAEVRAEAAAAVETVSSQPFQIVIIDWDMQPAAGLLLTAARERKASERPLTLALVSEDASVPKALQAGANSILRKPVVPNQAKDTLRTARDLLRARDSANTTAKAAAAGATTSAGSTLPPATPTTSAASIGKAAPPVSSVADIDPLAKHPQGFVLQRADNPLRGGDFLPASGQAPATQFDTESEMQKSIEQAAVAEVDPLKELEPMAAAVREETPAASEPTVDSDDDGPRNLEWYLKRKGIVRGPQAPAAAPAPQASAGPVAAPAKPELIGFDQTPVFTQSSTPEVQEAEAEPEPAPTRAPRGEKNEKKVEAQLFAYMDGEKPKETPAARSYEGWGKWIVWAVALAACAIVAAPQAPWHPQIRALWGRGRQQVHAWLNPQVATPAQAPASHESFGRAGDEYKLPTPETIPDATTDPAQIRVTPMVDPSAKKPNNDGPNPDQAGQTPAQQPAGTTSDPFQPGSSQSGSGQSGSAQSGAQPAGQPGAQPTSQPTLPAQPNPGVGNPSVPAAQPLAPPATATQASGSPAATPNTPVPQSLASPMPASPPPQAVNPATVPLSTGSSSGIPSSLKSQIGSMTPEVSGNKPAEAAMAAIEPVAISESAARAQLSGPGAVAYPASAKAQQGTVTLQVLIGRDGTVEDAKFLQGSLAFARAAIDGVKLWKFKPYIMNGRAVEVQTPMTITFRPQ